MALIPKANITTGNTIQASDITNIVESFDGTGLYTVITTGSFTGSFTGNLVGSASFATTASYVANASSFPFTGSAIISGSLIITGSLNAPNITGSVQGSSSYALTASYALNGGSSFPFTGSAIISSSLTVSGSVNISGSLRVRGAATQPTTENPLLYVKTSDASGTVTGIDGIYKEEGRPAIATNNKLGALNLSLVGSAAASGYANGLVIPVSQSVDPIIGSMYLDDGNKYLYIYTSTGWLFTQLQ